MSEIATTATVEHPAQAEHAEPTFLLWNAGGWVALAMLAVFLLMIWKKVPAAIGKALDNKIDVIRQQLAEAESLRKDAEALKAEYEAKAKSAEKEAAAVVERARKDAETIVAQAKTNAEALIERRQRMAEEKIAAEERAAVDQLRATTANAAREAAARLIRERVDAKADETIVGDAIRSIGGR